MGKIGIYGGTFDPIHTGHLIIADQTREIIGLDQILFLPNGTPPHKAHVRSTKFDRFNMLKLAVEDNIFFNVSDLEIKKEVINYTYDTIIEFKKILTDDIYFIIGADSLINIHTWYKHDELINLCKFVVLPRNINGARSELNHNDFMTNYIKNDLRADINQFILVDFPLLDISSTIIRNNISQNKSIKYMLPDKVIKYIYEENLY